MAGVGIESHTWSQKESIPEQNGSAGLNSLSVGNASLEADPEDMLVGDVIRKKRRLEKADGAASSQGGADAPNMAGTTNATALMKDKVVVLEVFASQQLEHGASLDDILGAMNIVAAKVDNLELSLKLVGGDLMGYSKEIATLAKEYNNLRREFNARSGTLDTLGIPSGYANAICRPTSSQPVVSNPSSVAPAPAPAIVPSPALPRLPLMDMEMCSKVKIECLNGSSFYGPTTAYLFSEMQRAGLPLSHGAPVFWPNDRFKIASVTFSHPSMAAS